MGKSPVHFLDRLRIALRAGNGGAGDPRWRCKGGDGGSIYMQAKKDFTMEQLLASNPLKKVQAGHGKDPGRRALIGSRGNDVTMQVPSGVTVGLDSGHVIGQLDAPGSRLLVARGGTGGGPKTGYSGQKGERYVVRLDLKLIADYGLVGFPNAGKSSLMSALSRASPKIGDYPFTTLKPQIATLDYPDHRQLSMADLPGLIEGAHVNVGLGHHFLKHVERTKCLLFVIDVAGFQFNQLTPYRAPLHTILLLNRELELYQPLLLDKPALCVLNKIDIPEGEKSAEEVILSLQDLNSRLKSDNRNTDCLLNDRTLDKDLLVEPKFMPRRLINFDQIFSVSAKEQINTQELKTSLREWLDEYARRNQAVEDSHKKELAAKKVDEAFIDSLPSRV